MINESYHYGVEELIHRYPALSVCKESINQAYQILFHCFSSGRKLLIAGNGGSCADSEHIVGELMKGFKKKRPVDDAFALKLESIGKEKGKELALSLQRGFPCIALDSHPGLNTAFINDIKNGGEFFFAQQLNVLGNEGDVFLGISTSGNSKDIVSAAITAKAKNRIIIGLTGENGGSLASLSDVTIRVPSNETFRIQEYHLPIYHCLCLMLEEAFF